MSAFTPAGSGGIPQQIQFTGATSPADQTISMPVAGTEYLLTLPTGTKQYLIQVLSAESFTVAADSGGPGFPVPRCCFLAEGGLSLTTIKTLFLKSAINNQTAVVRIWT